MKKRKWRSAKHKRETLELEESWIRLINETHPANPSLAREVGSASYEAPKIKRSQGSMPGVRVVLKPKLAEPKTEKRTEMRLEGTMLEREQLAQQEIEKKKQRTAPLYNKGPVQYITDDTDLTTLGRKV